MGKGFNQKSIFSISIFSNTQYYQENQQLLLAFQVLKYVVQQPPIQHMEINLLFGSTQKTGKDIYPIYTYSTLPTATLIRALFLLINSGNKKDYFNFMIYVCIDMQSICLLPTKGVLRYRFEIKSEIRAARQCLKNWFIDLKQMIGPDHLLPLSEI